MRWGIRFAVLAVALGLAFPGSAGAFGPLSSFGSFGSGAGKLNGPRAVVVGPDGAKYVAELVGRRVSVFNADGTFRRLIGVGALGAPAGLAIGPEGNLFVSDLEDSRVVVYSTAGEFVRAFGEAGPGAGFLVEPAGIEFDDSGLLHVADSGNARIDVFTPGGTFVRAFGQDVELGGSGDVCTAGFGCQPGVANGSAGAMDEPRDVAFGPAGELLVADESNRRVDVFTPNGAFLRAFGREVNLGAGDEDSCSSECKAGAATAAAGAFAAPSAIATDARGNVYVADGVNNRVGVSGVDGRFSRAFGEGVVDGSPFFQICTATGCQAGGAGTSPGATPKPHGVALDCHGAVYVAEEGPGFARVGRFGEAGTGPPPCADAPPAAAIEALSAEPPSNRFHFAGLVKNRGNGSAALFVRVPGPGRVILRGRGVRRLARSARQAQRVRLPIKPKVRLVHFLKKHGKARIRVEVTFRPIGGEPRTLEKVIVLKRKRG